MGFVGTPEAFTPGSEDWSLYAQRFQHFLLANGITEESQKLHLLLTLVGNSTFRLLTNLVAPRQPGELTFKEALTELERHFKPKPVIIAERFRFYKQNQQTAETVSEYVAELRRLATMCEFGTFLNEALCDRLVCGLREEAMQCRLLAELNLDLKRACELAQGMEAANRNAKEIQAKDSGGLVNSIKGRSQRAQLPRTRCLGVGHAPQNCRFRTAKCNRCQKVVHIARACKSKGSFRPQKFGNSRPKPERSQSVHNVTEKSKDPSFTRE